MPCQLKKKKKDITFPSEQFYKNFVALVKDNELHVDDYHVLCGSHRKHGSLIHLHMFTEDGVASMNVNSNNICSHL